MTTRVRGGGLGKSDNGDFDGEKIIFCTPFSGLLDPFCWFYAFLLLNRFHDPLSAYSVHHGHRKSTEKLVIFRHLFGHSWHGVFLRMAGGFVVFCRDGAKIAVVSPGAVVWCLGIVDVFVPEP